MWVLLAGVAAAQETPPAAKSAKWAGPEVTLHTNKGDIVITLEPNYPFEKLNRLRLVPSSVTQSVNVGLRVEVLDPVGNIFARIGGPSRQVGADRVAAVLTPGARSQAGHQHGVSALQPVRHADRR